MPPLDSDKKTIDSYFARGNRAADEHVAAAQARARGEEREDDPDPLPDPLRTIQTGEAVRNVLPKVAAEDGTPELLVVPDTRTPFDALFAALIAAATQALAAPDAIVAPASFDETPLQTEIRRADGRRMRLGVVIDGNKSDKPRAERHRKHIFAGRSVNATRPGWEAEYGLLIAAIKSLTDATAAEKAMIPVFEQGLADLRKAPAAASGRARTEVTYSRQVQVTTLALHAALGDFLSWAGSKATEKRLPALVRIITPPKRGERGEKPETPEQATPSVAQGTPGPVAAGTPAPGAAVTVTVPTESPVTGAGTVRPEV